jgi:hypothetical protein
VSIRPDKLYGDADDPLKIPALWLCTSADFADRRAKGGDETTGTFRRVRDLVASCRLLWRLSGDAVGEFDLAEQCSGWRSWIFSNRKWRSFQQQLCGGMEQLLPDDDVRQWQPAYCHDLVDADRTAGHGRGLRIQPYEHPNPWYGRNHDVECELVQSPRLKFGFVHS